MIETSAAMRLIKGLVDATKSGRLTWDSDIRSARAEPGLISSTVLKMVSGGQTFAARTSTRHYELTSRDSRGRAPHELVIWDLERSQTRPALVLESITSPNVDQRVLNIALQNLFDVVKGTIESDDEIVDRLLGGL